MTREEMVSCIGTIARSGSKAFVKEVQDAGGSASGAGESIIGQFGVGFYSAFMVGEKLEVFSKSHKADEPAHVWSSDGSGSSKVHSLTMHYWIPALIQRMTSFLSTPLHSSFPLV
jgi:TNF receptor-associated protein 1